MTSPRSLLGWLPPRVPHPPMTMAMRHRLSILVRQNHGAAPPIRIDHMADPPGRPPVWWAFARPLPDRRSAAYDRSSEQEGGAVVACRSYHRAYCGDAPYVATS